jgi:predicted nucleic acid-binding Zn ribbon protein
MTPTKMRAFRRRLDYVLRKAFPRAEAAAIWQAANWLERLLLVEAHKIVEAEHEPNCACWNCVLSLHADVARHMAELRVAQEAAAEHD